MTDEQRMGITAGILIGAAILVGMAISFVVAMISAAILQVFS